jgi:hypothetical protein
MPSANQDQALQHLKQWADRTGYQVGPIEGTGNDFILEVTERDTFPSVQFIHQRKEQPYLLVVGQVKVPQEDRQLLKRALGEGFKRFIWDLKLVLLDKGVDFIVIGEDEGDPDAWEVHLRIYVKEFDPNLLQGAYTRVKNSLIAVIWSYKRALDQAAMFSAGPSEQFPLPADDVDMDVAEDPGRSRRIMNVMANTGIIMMVTLVDGFAQTMMDVAGAMAEGMTEAFEGEEAAEQVAREIEERTPEAKGQMMGMISEMRQQLYGQMAQKVGEIGPLLNDRVFDKGPEMVDVYEFGLPRLTEELDDATIAEYAKLLVQEDKYFTEMFGELTAWMNGLPQLPK